MGDWNEHDRDPWPPLVRILHLRRLMLVHSYLYYELGESQVSDHLWQEWADELAELQGTFDWRIGFYDPQFRDWDGSTGYHLKYDVSVRRVAERLMLGQQRPAPGPARKQLKRQGTLW